MFSITLVIASVLALAILKLASRFIFGHRSPYPLPPGPPKEPILGHLRIIPGQFAQNAYQNWSKEYGQYLVMNTHRLWQGNALEYDDVLTD